jgi:hypothetical protein
MPMKTSRVTIDHDEIREWADARCGRPSMVTGTGRGDQTGILRIDFPGYSGRGTLEPISWDEFFDKFEASKLALVYSAHAHGHRSNFNKLIARESVDLETGEKLGLSRHRRKQAEQARATAKRSASSERATPPRRATAKKSISEKTPARRATPRRATPSGPAASGERRAPRSEAAHKVSKVSNKPTGRSAQRGGARQNPKRRGPKV